MGVARGRLFQWSASRFAQQQARSAGSAVSATASCPPRVPPPTARPRRQVGWMSAGSAGSSPVTPPLDLGWDAAEMAVRAATLLGTMAATEAAGSTAGQQGQPPVSPRPPGRVQDRSRSPTARVSVAAAGPPPRVWEWTPKIQLGTRVEEKISPRQNSGDMPLSWSPRWHSTSSSAVGRQPSWHGGRSWGDAYKRSCS